MYLPKIKKYQKKFDYSYAFGAYPVLELLKNKKEEIYSIYFKKEGLKSEGIEEIKELSEKGEIYTEVNDRLVEKISVKENTYVVGVFKKYERSIEENRNHLVLVNPSNKGNLGTIIRTMLGFNFRDLAIIEPSVDIFDPMVVRATMGGLFGIRFQHFESIEKYIKKFPKQNLYPFMLNGEKSIQEVVFKKPLSIIQGNESTGLDDKYLQLGESVYIPSSKDIDSLNLAIATGISLWEASKK